MAAIVILSAVVDYKCAAAEEVKTPQDFTSSRETELALAKSNFIKAAKMQAWQEYVEQNDLTGQGIAEDEAMQETLQALNQSKAVQKIQEMAEAQAAQAEQEAQVEPSEQVTITMNEVDFISVAPEEPSALLDGWVVDDEYKGSPISLTSENRKNLERLVTGEAGNQGFIGAALVAQTIHDTMIADDEYDVVTIKKTHGYEASLNKEPNQDVLDAVSFIFDDGGMAVQHELTYFYAPKIVRSNFHESQLFIVEYKGHRFFSER